MRNKLMISIVVITWLYSCGQRSDSEREKVVVQAEVEATKRNNSRLSQNPDLEKYIYTDTTYTTSTGKGITIQNSFPKGGMIGPGGEQYFDSSGKRYAFAVFWTRVINETNIPFELNVKIPSDSFAIFAPPDSYLRLLLPSQTMTIDKLSKFSYGLTDTKSYLDANLNKTSLLRKTISPNEEHIFYVVTLSYKVGGTARAGLILNEQNLYYRMSIEPYGSGTIPVGKIAFKPNSDN